MLCCSCPPRSATKEGYETSTAQRWFGLLRSKIESLEFFLVGRGQAAIKKDWRVARFSHQKECVVASYQAETDTRNNNHKQSADRESACRTVQGGENANSLQYEARIRELLAPSHSAALGRFSAHRCTGPTCTDVAGHARIGSEEQSRASGTHSHLVGLRDVAGRRSGAA